MDDLLAARAQMAMSLGFHILFAVVGMALPVLMSVAEWRWLRTGEAVYQDLARRWARGAAILFAVGAVSGTVLSFELGLLWPRFMALAGPLIGMPFSLEGFAFFLEAIFLGVYLYGWERVHRWAHFAAGVGVAVSGLASGVFVMAVNAFMNTPDGLRVDTAGRIHDVDVWDAFFSPAFPTQALHMAGAAYASVAFAVLGIHAWRLLRDPQSSFHRAAVRIAFPLALLAAPLQLVSGDLSAKHLHVAQPVKLAAAEGLFRTERGAALAIGGLPNVERAETPYAIRVPYALSFLATGDPHGEVKGLAEFPREEWPPVLVVHIAFQVMVGCGLALLALCALGVVLRLRRQRLEDSRMFLRAAVIVAPLGLVALEAGWVVTEVGRQPWILRGLMRTADAVTPMPGLAVPFAVFTLLYVFLGVVVLGALRRHVFSVPPATDEPTGATDGA